MTHANHAAHSVTAMLIASSALAQSFTPLDGRVAGGAGARANGVSPGGTYVVGEATTASGGVVAVRWDPDGGQVLGYAPSSSDPWQSSAQDVSFDGTVVCGVAWLGSLGHGWRWTEAEGFENLGDLPGGGYSTLARSMSGDGARVAGATKSAEGYRPSIWEVDMGWTQYLPPGVGSPEYPGSFIGISPNGQWAGGGQWYGLAQPPYPPFEAIRWSAQSGLVELVPDLPGGGDPYARFYALDDDGDGVGFATDDQGTQAMRFTPATGILGLGDFEGGFFSSLAWDLSNGGRLIVGTGSTEVGFEAAIWTCSAGPVRLVDYLAARNISIPDGWRLVEAYAISSSGDAIVGYARDMAGVEHGWLVTLPAANLADINADGAVDGEDVGMLLAAWAEEEALVDLNCDGVVDGADLGILLASWTG